MDQYAGPSNYIDLAPYERIVREDREIFTGNPDLNPTTSMNFDLMAEHYFRSVGIISGGVFYKDLKDFIYTFVTEDETTGYKRFQPFNGTKPTFSAWKPLFSDNSIFCRVLPGIWACM